MGNSSFSHVVPPLCISSVVDLNGQEAMWQQWHELGLIESLGSNAGDEWSEGMMPNPVQCMERQVLASLNMKINNFLLLPKNFPGLTQSTQEE